MKFINLNIEKGEDIFPAGTIFVSGQNGVLIMKKNGILKKFFERDKKVLGIRILFESGVKNLLDIAKQMRTAFLLGERSDLVPVGVVEVATFYKKPHWHHYDVAIE